MTNHHLKWVKWAMCMLAVSTWLTGPFSNASQSANHTSKRSDAVAPTCVDNSPAVWFASPTGNDGSSNPHNHNTPMTFRGAAEAAQLGDKVCVMGGTYAQVQTFYPPRSGTPLAWIVYQAYGDGPANIVWAATGLHCPPEGTDDCTMINVNALHGNSYLEFRGLNFDGRGLAGNAFACNNSHHLRYIGNTVFNVQGSGIGAVQCDYLTSDHNIVYHSGYSGTLANWTSGISYNQIKAFDCNDGLHNVISNNIVVGQYDNSPNHSDGNAFILDIDATPSGCAGTAAPYEPAALIVNNVAYGNGGRCAEALQVSFFWMMANNTCFKNNLDNVNANQANAASLDSNTASNGYFANNISVSWQASNPPYDQRNANVNIQYFANLAWGAPRFADPSGADFCAKSPQFIKADPTTVAPPYFDPSASGQYATAEPPFLLRNGLALQPGSPARCRGVDPTTLPGVPAQIAADMKNPSNVYFIYRNLNGNARPCMGSCWDLGAYQH